MSQGNVELVLALYPGPGVDLVPLFRDEARSREILAEAASLLHVDCECTGPSPPGRLRAGTGIDGLSSVWRATLAPWSMLRAEVEQAIDCGERVLVQHRVFGRRTGSTTVEMVSGADLWTFREAKVARVDLYLDRAEAFSAVGLEEPSQ